MSLRVARRARSNLLPSITSNGGDCLVTLFWQRHNDRPSICSLKRVPLTALLLGNNSKLDDGRGWPSAVRFAQTCHFNRRASGNRPRASSNRPRAFSNHRRPFSNRPRPFSNHPRPSSNRPRPFSNRPRPFSNHRRALSNHRRASGGRVRQFTPVNMPHLNTGNHLPRELRISRIRSSNSGEASRDSLCTAVCASTTL